MISLLRVTLIKIVLSNFRFDDGKHTGGFAFKVQFPWWRNQQFVHVGCKDAWLSARTHCIMGKGSHSSPKPLWLYPYWILSTCHDHTDNWWKASSEIKKRSVIFLPVSIISTTRKQQMLETWNVSYRLWWQRLERIILWVFLHILIVRVGDHRQLLWFWIFLL